ncbi:hypothetical protein NS355_17195 [Sphingomonas yabuuchiae]|uniref:Uncharacterized protein n=1 Tax=Sphingomonas yabuuchiae TaxID=172044 RepID=A0A147IJR5_9SPHN|nr:hypothetical protein NS355_17195 [Sphingomonas yabuuchiae]
MDQRRPPHPTAHEAHRPPGRGVDRVPRRLAERALGEGREIGPVAGGGDRHVGRGPVEKRQIESRAARTRNRDRQPVGDQRVRPDRRRGWCRGWNRGWSRRRTGYRPDQVRRTAVGAGLDQRQHDGTGGPGQDIAAGQERRIGHESTRGG